MWLPAISPRRTLSRNNFLWNLFNLSAVVLCVACCFCIWPSRHLTFETARKLMPLARPMWRTRLPTYASGLRRRGGEKRPKNLSKIRVRKRGSVNKLLLFWTLDSSTYYTSHIWLTHSSFCYVLSPNMKIQACQDLRRLKRSKNVRKQAFIKRKLWARFLSTSFSEAIKDGERVGWQWLIGVKFEPVYSPYRLLQHCRRQVELI